MSVRCKRNCTDARASAREPWGLSKKGWECSLPRQEPQLSWSLSYEMPPGAGKASFGCKAGKEAAGGMIVLVLSPLSS